MIHIETPRLILKSHTEKNLTKLHEWFNDPELTYYDDDDPVSEDPIPVERIEAILERMMTRTLEDGIIHYAIHKKDDDCLIGYGMIANINTYNQRCDLGISMGEKQFWGNGYGRETIEAIIAYCFTTLNLNRIGAAIYEFNLRSKHLFEGLGFQQEGVLRQNVLKDGVFKDECLYSLLRESWESK
jgi:RimJ/RimL family protein N-acetyltransferase